MAELTRELEFRGRYCEQAPRVKAEGLRPASVAYGMIRRLEDAPLFKPYFYSGDAFILYPDRSIGYAWDSELLRNLASSDMRSLQNGQLPITFEQAEKMIQHKFPRKEVEDMIIDKDLTQTQANAHSLWKAASRHPEYTPSALALDERLLSAYTCKISVQGEGIGMGIFLPAFPNKQPLLGAAYVDGLGCWSRLFGRYRLDYDIGRLVRSAPEALTQKAMNSRFRDYLGQRELKAMERHAQQRYTPDEINRVQVVGNSARLQDNHPNHTPLNSKVPEPQYSYIPLELVAQNDGPVSQDGRIIPLEPLN